MQEKEKIDLTKPGQVLLLLGVCAIGIDRMHDK